MASQRDLHIGSSGRNCLEVSAAESGQKLLRFLERRSSLPASLLHRWIRTGQIRLNGGRIKPFARISEKDIIRLPPFASSVAEFETLVGNQEQEARERQVVILEEHDGIIALDKPGGLPVQPGTGHEESLAASMKAVFKNSAYIPAPVHRLDRDTTGIILAGLSWQKQRDLHEEFQAGKIHKEYLAWVHGSWQLGNICVSHFFCASVNREQERTAVLDAASPECRKGMLQIYPLRVEKDKSLLQIRLYTGIKHQIRAQLAHLGYPILGDGKYGLRRETVLYLDAYRIILCDGHEICRMPHWEKDMLPREMPAPLK